MAITEYDVRRQYDSGNPYSQFNGPVYDNTPRDFIPLLDTIRTEEEWVETALPIKRKRDGTYKTIIKKGLYYGFSILAGYGTTIDELRAIETGRKIYYKARDVYSYLLQGCSYEDFSDITNDIYHYCEALLLIDKNEIAEALRHSIEAYQIKPCENDYANLTFELRLKLSDETVIDDEIRFYENDIDSCIHTDRAYKWISFLMKHKKFNKASAAISRINELLDDLMAGRRKNERYGGKPDRFSCDYWYGIYKEKFNKKIEKTILRLQAIKEKQNGI